VLSQPDSERAFCAPENAQEKKITGSTGRMHGEIPVIKPPRKPMRTSANMSRPSYSEPAYSEPGPAHGRGDLVGGGIGTVSTR
jgi:hypothetical protein